MSYFFQNRLRKEKQHVVNGNADADAEMPWLRFPNGQSLVNEQPLRKS